MADYHELTSQIPPPTAALCHDGQCGSHHAVPGPGKFFSAIRGLANLTGTVHVSFQGAHQSILSLSSACMAVKPASFLYTVDRASAVATITLNRPERLNALTFEVYTELRDTFRALDSEVGVRAIIITGTGRAFCTGGDVEDIIGALFSRDAAGLLEFTRLTGDLILSIRQCRRPVVAALNGTVAGAGAVIAAASDIRIAAEGAKIAFLFSRVGLTGADMGAAWLLPRIVGMARASEILMLGDFISAQRAAEIGLYNRVVPGEQLLKEATDVACRLARGPSVALGITKQALNEEASMDLVSAIEWEAKAQAECMQNPNFRKAYEAFRAKRDPEFE